MFQSYSPRQVTILSHTSPTSCKTYASSEYIGGATNSLAICSVASTRFDMSLSEQALPGEPTLSRDYLQPLDQKMSLEWTVGDRFSQCLWQKGQ